MRKATAITLDEQERLALGRWARGRKTPARLVLRAQIVLRAADGMDNLSIADELGTGRLTVARWRNRFATGRLAGIERDARAAAANPPPAAGSLSGSSRRPRKRRRPPPPTGARARWPTPSG